MDQWRVINEYIEDKIAKSIAKAGNLSFYCKVESTDGYYVSIIPASNENNIEAFQNIPILQSKYISPVVQEGDYGIALNLGIQIGNLIEADTESEVKKGDYYVFVPLILQSEFQSSTDELLLSSPDLNTSIKLSNSAIDIKSDGECTQALDGNNSITIGGDFNQDVTGSIKISSTGDLEIKGGANAIVVGNQVGTLADVVTALVGMMDLLASGMAGSATTPTAYQSGKTAYQQQINMIVG